MARLKRECRIFLIQQISWLADRIRDGAIETSTFSKVKRAGLSQGLPIGFAMARLKQSVSKPYGLYRRSYGLPIGFAMARLKRPLALPQLAQSSRLADRIRDGAIETSTGTGWMARKSWWLADRIRDGAIET